MGVTVSGHKEQVLSSMLTLLTLLRSERMKSFLTEVPGESWGIGKRT
jgi:hypothetical protein